MRSPALWIGIVALFVLGCGRIAGLDDYAVTEPPRPTEEDSSTPEIDQDSSTQGNDGDSATRDIDPVWGCLDGPGREPAGPGPFNVAIHVEHIRMAQPIEGAEVALFRKIDGEEKMPESPPGLKTDLEGNVTFNIFPENTTRDRLGIQAYLRVLKNSDPALPDDRIVPSYFYLNPPVSSDVNVAVPMANVGLRRALTPLVGSEQRDDLGLILIAALNCQNTGVAGVVFDLDPPEAASTRFYVIDGIPDKSLPATLATGFGGFTNVQPGTVTIKGTLAETGRPIGSVSVVVRPDAITQSRLVPRWPPP